jgi:hypothetical protein
MREFEIRSAQMRVPQRLLLTVLTFLTFSVIVIPNVRGDEPVPGVPADRTEDKFDFFFDPYKREAIREFNTARSDHLLLAMNIVMRCAEGQWSPEMQAAMLMDLDQSLVHPLGQSSASNFKLYQKKVFKNWFEIASLSYSDRLARDRIFYQEKLNGDQLNARRFQWVIALAGGIATVLIGIKALWQTNTRPRLGHAIGIFALVFSALGTTLTTVSAFYGSQDEATRGQRTVAQLRQLHWRVINDVEGEAYLCSDLSEPKDDKVPAKNEKDDVHRHLVDTITSWKNRHETILNDALPSLAKTGDLAKPGDERPHPTPTAPLTLPSTPPPLAGAGTETERGKGKTDGGTVQQ